MDDINFEELFDQNGRKNEIGTGKKMEKPSRNNRLAYGLAVIILLAVFVLSLRYIDKIIEFPQESYPSLKETVSETAHIEETTAPIEVLSKGIIAPLGSWKEDGSLGYGLPIQFELGDLQLAQENITFHISMDSGFLIGDITLDKYKEHSWDETGTVESATIGESAQISNGETVYWQGSLDGDSQNDVVYGKVIIMGETAILGYGVFGITFNPVTEAYSADTLLCEYFAPVNGEYQEISGVYIQEQFSTITGETVETPIVDDIIQVLGGWSPNGGIPLRLSLEDLNYEGKVIKFQVKTGAGYFIGDGTLNKYQNRPEGAMLGTEFTVDNREELHWFSSVECEEKVYVEVLILCEEQYIGYAVAEIVDDKTLTVLDSNYWQYTDEEFPDITKDFLENKIQEIKVSNEE